MKALDRNLLIDWAKTLKSGKYKQGQGYLRQNDAYCCLGVLCDVFDSSNWIRTTHIDNNYFCYRTDQCYAGDLPKCFDELIPAYIKY